MKNLSRAGRGRDREGPSVQVKAAVITALAMVAGAAQAQGAAYTTPQPYQAPVRYTIGTGIGQQGLQRGTVFLPRVEGAIQYVSNINLARDDEREIDTAGLEVAPGFYASYFSNAFTGAIDYSLIGRVWGDSDYNDVSHRLAANGQWYAVPEWFSLRGQASYYDSVLNPSRSLNYGRLGIFGASNLTDVATASISPVLSHNFNRFQFTAQYSYGWTWYLNEGKGQPTFGFVTQQDSEDQFAKLSLGTAQDGRRLSGQIYYDWQHSEYETAIPYEYERAGISLSWRLGRSLSLVGDYGWESDLLESTTEGGLDSEFWSAGFRWTPNDRNFVEARTGDRFFGQSYSLQVRHRARLLEFTASYSEEPTVQTRELSLGDFDPGELPPDDPRFDFGRFNSVPYVRKGGFGSIALVGSRTRLDLRAFYYERDYLRGVSIGTFQRRDELQKGVGLRSTRQLASNLSMELDLLYTEYERSLPELEPLEDSITKDYDTQAVFRLNRETSPRFVVTAEAGYLNRSGDTDYDGWWVGLRGRWSPYASADTP